MKDDIREFEKMIDTMPDDLRRDVEIHLPEGVSEMLKRCEAERTRRNAEIDGNIKLIIASMMASQDKVLPPGEWRMSMDGKRLLIKIG